MATLNRLDGTFEISAALPVIALRDLVFFPYMVVPLLIGRPPSLAALEEARTDGGLALLAAQKDATVDEPGRDDLYRAGTVIRVVQVSGLADGTARVVMEGMGRARIKRFLPSGSCFRASVELLTAWEFEPDPPEDPGLAALTAKVTRMFRDYVRLSEKIPNEVIAAAAEISDRVRLAHLISGHLLIGTSEKQELLEETDNASRYGILLELLVREVEILRIQEKLDRQIRLQAEDDDPAPSIEEQLGSLLPEPGGGDPEWAELERTIGRTPLPAAARDRAEKEFERLRKLNPVAPEAAVIRSYLDWILALPWESETSDSLDVERAEAVLEGEHYGLEEVKERILDHIAVLSLVGRLQGPILCLVGPSGVGKTSLGRSIARCLKREFVRVSLGGVRDEAEIRGHRRTYVGALPGRVIQGIRKSGSRNPVFLLDEADKLARDFHGDPGAALLEVLDPEQNRAFTDHYLELEFDLSHVLFIATANTLGEIPGPLRDRMEVIRLPGYLDTEKKVIARQFLWPKQVARHGIEPLAPEISGRAIERIVAEYTREAGVRELERRLSRVARKLARGGGERRAQQAGARGGGRPAGASGAARPPAAEPRRGARPGRHRLRARLDGGRRRGDGGRGGGGARFGEDTADRHARGRDEGVGLRGRDLRAFAGAPARAPGAVPPRAGHSHSHPRGSDAEGRSLGRDHHRGGANLGADRNPHPGRSRDDRRDHAAGTRARRGRDQGEGGGGAARRDQARAAPRDERDGHREAPRRGARGSGAGPGRDHGPGAAGGAGARAEAAEGPGRRRAVAGGPGTRYPPLLRRPPW